MKAKKDWCTEPRPKTYMGWSSNFDKKDVPKYLRCPGCNRRLKVRVEVFCGQVYWELPPHKTPPKTYKRPSKRQ